MVIEAYAKYDKPMSNQKIVMGQKRKHVIHPVNLILRSKVNVVYWVHECMRHIFS